MAYPVSNPIKPTKLDQLHADAYADISAPQLREFFACRERELKELEGMYDLLWNWLSEDEQQEFLQTYLKGK